MKAKAFHRLLARRARLVRCAVWISICGAAVPAAALETAPERPLWVPVRAHTRDGSSFRALARADASASAFRDEDGRTTPVEWARVCTLTLAERPSRALEEQAAQAVRELGDESYLVREKARLNLKALGRAAERALRQAATSSDPEVASKARQLLADTAGLEQAPSLDQLVLDDGRLLNGTLEGEGVELQTRWGLFRFAADALEKLEAADGAPGVSPPPGDAQPAQASAPPPSPLRPAEHWQFFGTMDKPVGLSIPITRLAVAFDTSPLTGEPLQVGESIEDLYANLGLLLRASGERERVVLVKTDAKAGREEHLAATANDAPGIEFSFVVPGSFDPGTRRGRPAGVEVFYCHVADTSPGDLLLEAFDRTGRMLYRSLNTLADHGEPRLPESANFLGMSSVVPIAKVSLSLATGRVGKLHLTSVSCSTPVPTDRNLGVALIELRDGDRLSGQLVPRAEDLTLLPGFFPPGLPPVPLKLDDVTRYEPPSTRNGRASLELYFETPHAVWLQEGSAFRAQFMKLDHKEVQLALPGGVALALPRGMLRKVDFCPEPAAGATPVAESERPGVEFRSRAAPPPQAPSPGEAKAPPPGEAKAPPAGENKGAPAAGENKGAPAAKTFAPGLPRMDNAEVLSAEYGSGELSVDPKDGAGAWQIDLHTVHLLVFPRAQPAQPAEGRATEHIRPPEWTLTLRHGGRLNVKVVSIAPDFVAVELGGIPLKFPNAVVSSLQRRGEGK